MYGKLFTQMYDGTLVSKWQALVTFQQMIVLCDADGVLDMTPDALSDRTGIPLKIIKAGIAELEKPDPKSRTPDEDGRRIARLDTHRDWGWYLVNHKKYQSHVDAETIREQNRIRKARQRARTGECHGKNVTERDGHADVTQGHVSSRHTDTDTDTEKKKNLAVNGRDHFADWFETFWRAYPRKAKKPAALKAFRATKPCEEVVQQMLSAIEAAKSSEQWQDAKYIPHPATWLNNRRWEDEPELPLNAGHRNAVPGTNFVA